MQNNPNAYRAMAIRTVRFTMSQSLDGKLHISIPLADEVGDSSVGAAQSFFIRQEYDAEGPRPGLLAEAGAVDDHDMFLADKFFHEDFIAFGNIDAGKG